jgi:hypothetical protein
MPRDATVVRRQRNVKKERQRERERERMREREREHYARYVGKRRGEKYE